PAASWGAGPAETAPRAREFPRTDARPWCVRRSTQGGVNDDVGDPWQRPAVARVVRGGVDAPGDAVERPRDGGRRDRAAGPARPTDAALLAPHPGGGAAQRARCRGPHGAHAA